MFLLRHKRKIVRLTVDLAQCNLCVQKCCNSGRRFITKYGHHSKQRAAESPTAVCLKQHTIPHCADVKCYGLTQERNRAWVIRNERKISLVLKASTMNTAPVATSRRAIIP